jgi:hypothetical protein
MDTDEAIKRAVRAFYEGADFDEYRKVTGSETKYKKDSFDELEKNLRKGKKPEVKEEV